MYCRYITYENLIVIKNEARSETLTLFSKVPSKYRGITCCGGQPLCHSPPTRHVILRALRFKCFVSLTPNKRTLRAFNSQVCVLFNLGAESLTRIKSGESNLSDLRFVARAIIGGCSRVLPGNGFENTGWISSDGTIVCRQVKEANFNIFKEKS